MKQTHYTLYIINRVLHVIIAGEKGRDAQKPIGRPGAKGKI